MKLEHLTSLTLSLQVTWSLAPAAPCICLILLALSLQSAFSVVVCLCAKHGFLLGITFLVKHPIWNDKCLQGPVSDSWGKVQLNQLRPVIRSGPKRLVHIHTTSGEEASVSLVSQVWKELVCVPVAAWKSHLFAGPALLIFSSFPFGPFIIVSPSPFALLTSFSLLCLPVDASEKLHGTSGGGTLS